MGGFDIEPNIYNAASLKNIDLSAVTAVAPASRLFSTSSRTALFTSVMLQMTSLLLTI